MGLKKNRLSEGIREGDELRREAVDTGQKLFGEGKEIKALLEGIDTSMDEDDLNAVQRAERGYGEDFNGSFKAEVDSRAAEVHRIEAESLENTQDELVKVNEALGRFSEMEGVTDIGRRHAADAGSHLEVSAADYEGMMDQAQAILESTEREVADLKNSLDGIFG